MPPIPSLPFKTRQLVVILLSIFSAVVVSAVIAYGIGKLINRYREHKHNKALVTQKAMDIEAPIIAADKWSMHRTLSQISLSDVSLVPSFPPTVHVGLREKQRVQAQVQTRTVPVSAPAARSWSDSRIITSVPVRPIVAPTASRHHHHHHHLLRSLTTISMCDRYPIFIPSSSRLSPSGPGTVVSFSGKPLLVTTTEGRDVMCVGVQEQQQQQQHCNTSTTVATLTVSTSAAERIGLCMMQMEEDDSGTVLNPTPDEDKDKDADKDADKDNTSESLLAYYHLP